MGRDIEKKLAFLLDSPGYESVLQRVAGLATAVKIDGAVLRVDFPNARYLLAGARRKGAVKSSLPESFRKILELHAYVAFPAEFGALRLAGDGCGFEPESLVEEDSDLLTHVKNAKQIVCPLSDYSDWWLYHPGEKNSSGQPALCKLSHEGGDVDAAAPENVGALFLRRMAEILEVDAIADVPAAMGDDLLAWWNALSMRWKVTFCGNLGWPENHQPKNAELKKCLALKDLYFVTDKSLKPVERLEKLRRIQINGNAVTSKEELATFLRTRPKVKVKDERR